VEALIVASLVELLAWDLLEHREDHFREAVEEVLALMHPQNLEEILRVTEAQEFSLYILL
jgi:hypothetical protein